MIAGLGWSASDIVLAVQVINKVCTAFRKVGGADDQYASTVTFLDAFARTMQRIQGYIDSSTSPDFQGLSEDLTAQMKVIYVEYVKFDMYLRKVEPGLSSASFTSRIAARTKWAIKEIHHRVESLKKAVISPMMFVSPLLAVETLKELQELRGQLPDVSQQEAALRENRMLVLRVNDNLEKLRGSLESFWWSRRWALSAVEEDVKLLTSAAKNNQDLVQSSKSDVQDTVAKEHAQTRREMAASNIGTISAVEMIMEAKLAQMESKIDVMISEHRSKTGKDDAELQSVKSRISNSRAHLKQAISSARQMLKHFGLLVKAVNSMHRNPVTQWMLPLANGLVGYEKIFDHGDKMVKSAGKTLTAGGKYMEETDLVKGMKSWNPFTAAVQGQKNRMEHSGSISPPLKTPETPTLSRATTLASDTSDLGGRDGNGPYTTVAFSAAKAQADILENSSRTKPPIVSEQEPAPTSAITALYNKTSEGNLELLLDVGDLVPAKSSHNTKCIDEGMRHEVPRVTVLPLDDFEENPWA